MDLSRLFFQPLRRLEKQFEGLLVFKIRFSVEAEEQAFAQLPKICLGPRSVLRLLAEIGTAKELIFRGACPTTYSTHQQMLHVHPCDAETLS